MAAERRKAIGAKLRTELVLPVKPPFHFVGSVCKPSHFPSSDVAFDGTTYWQTVRFGSRVLGICMSAAGSAAAPGVSLAVYSTGALPAAFVAQLAREITYRFDLEADLAAFGRLCMRDPLLRPVWDRWEGMRVSVGQSLYEFLVIATVLQNATVRRSVQMLEALFRRFGTRLSFDGQTLCAFWAPEDVDAADEHELREIKLGYRAKTIKRQTRAIVAGGLSEEELRALPSVELRSRLLRVYGVGPASVGYLMFEVFKRYDAFVHVSPWEQKIFSRLLFDEELVDPDRILLEVDRRWGQWKYLASHYLFEDLFWRRKAESIPWLDALIRL